MKTNIKVLYSHSRFYVLPSATPEPSTRILELDGEENESLSEERKQKQGITVSSLEYIFVG